MNKYTKPWFKKVRGSYLPARWQGWALYIPFVLYLVAVLVDIGRTDMSAEHAFYAAFPQFVCAGIVMTWIASKTSRK